MLLRTKTISPRARLLVDEAESLEVLNLFERSLNLVAPDDQVLSIVGSSIGPGPFSAEVEFSGEDTLDHLDFRRLFSIESKVHPAPGGLIVSGNRIDCTASLTWDPTPDWNAVSSAKLDKSLPIIENAALVLAKPESLVTPMLKGQQSAVHHVKALDAWRSFSTGIQTQNYDMVRVGVEGFTGLGPGLTPAGDDFLMGVIYSIWARGTELNLETYICQIVQFTESRTTTLSKAWLRAAADGEAAYSWHRLIKGISMADPDGIFAAAKAILNHGSSSGADGLAGFLIGARTLDQYQELP